LLVDSLLPAPKAHFNCQELRHR